MRQNIILAGVGGQGILTIARGLSIAALGKGLLVRQAEVHGMSQRGGAVYSHLRFSDGEIYSDLIPPGQVDMILAVEPLEALRYSELLREDGCVIASTNAVANIGNYPPIEDVLRAIAKFPRHVLIDMEKLGRAAGSTLTANIVALGASSLYLGFSPHEIEGAIEILFERKGERIVEANKRAFRFGRTAATAYVGGLQRGGSPQSVRDWVETLSPELLASEDSIDFAQVSWHEAEDRLSGAESHAFEGILMDAYEEGRSQLYEHEVYTLIELVGAIDPPKHVFVPKGSMVSKEILEQFSGDQVVLKLVSPTIVHKSDANAVLFVPKTVEAVRQEFDRLIERHAGTAVVSGVLVVEYVRPEFRGFGGELFVGIRATREFGPVIAAGLGGLDTEYLATKMRPGIAVAKAVATDVSAEEFLELFKETAAYDVLAGRARGHERIVSDGELLRCFRAFISIARRFCVDRGDQGPDVGEFEVNPFAFRNQLLVPLDGRGRLQTATRRLPERPLDRVRKLLVPQSMALVGVSSNPESFGRIILQNVLRGGFDPDRLWVVKNDAAEVDGVRCVATLADLPEPVDLLVVTAPAAAVPGIIDQANSSGKALSCIVISGGAGETEGTGDLGQQVKEAILRGRAQPDGGLVVLGPNCMGVQSRPGRYDTFFIPESKLDSRRDAPPKPVAVVSQSGAFIVSRLSNLNTLDPAFAVSIGNQADVTVADLTRALAERDDIQVVGVYLEGFADLDGLDFLRAVGDLTRRGKTVVFYKAGRTETGRSAAAGHTASVAGDYDICQAAVRHAGGLVAESFGEFERLLETATLLAGRHVTGGRLYAVTNAGMEAVGMADALSSGSPVRFASTSERFEVAVRGVLARHRLDRLVSPRNPLDVTPMADEDAYDELVRLALASDEVDALIVSCVPLTPQLKTLPSELGVSGAFPDRVTGWLEESKKPIVFVVDAGQSYDAFTTAVRERGVPAFRSADEAARCLERYLTVRMAQPAAQTTESFVGASSDQ